MNISFDAKRAFHNNRGLGNYSRDVIRLLTTFFPENNYYLLNPKHKSNNSYSAPAAAKEINPNGIFYKTFPSLWRSKGCLKDIYGLKSDIYHGLSQELPDGIHKVGVKTVVTMHDAIFIRYPELYDSLYRKIFIKKNEYACKSADKIIAISEQTKNDFIEFFHADPSKIEVVYQGCNNIFRVLSDPAVLRNSKEKYNLPENYLLNVGAIEKRKNLETIIRAMHMGNIDLPLVVIGGKTNYLNEVNELIAQLKLQDRVIFLHNVPTENLPSIYQMASLFIYPSRFEGFGIPILEALCTGTPVLTSRGSCFEETGGKGAHYVDYDNAEEMAQEINTILRDDEMRERMVADGLAHAENFTDDKIANNLIRVYQSVL